MNVSTDVSQKFLLSGSLCDRIGFSVISSMDEVLRWKRAKSTKRER